MTARASRPRASRRSRASAPAKGELPTAAIIADTHLPRGTRRLPEECVRRLIAADLILHAGDIASVQALAEFEGFGPVAAVHGNVDEPALRERLPADLVVELGGARIGVVHDAGPRTRRHERLLARFPNCHVIVYGHTHAPELARAGETWILSPGSPTERRRAANRSMALVTIAGGRIRPLLVPLP